MSFHDVPDGYFCMCMRPYDQCMCKDVIRGMNQRDQSWSLLDRLVEKVSPDVGQALREKAAPYREQGWGVKSTFQSNTSTEVSLVLTKGTDQTRITVD